MLLGDHLVAKVLQNDDDGLKALLEEGYDVNAPSPGYGTALQAAACKGNRNMLQIMLDAHADINAKGGQYGCALIAAVVENHVSAVKQLLRYRADVFVSGGRYVSALYQAVDFGNVDITHMLLEKGAWLTGDYGELLDLAAERGEGEIRRELELYDVRGLHLSRDGARQKPKREQETKSKDADDVVERRAFGSLQKNGSLGVILFWEAAKLQGLEGKWTGIKGVKILQVALENGFSEDVIDKIRPHIHSWPSIQKFFADAVGERLGGRLQPVKHTNLLAAENGRSEDDRTGRDREILLTPPSQSGRRTRSAEERPGQARSHRDRASSDASRRV